MTAQYVSSSWARSRAPVWVVQLRIGLPGGWGERRDESSSAVGRGGFGPSPPPRFAVFGHNPPQEVDAFFGRSSFPVRDCRDESPPAQRSAAAFVEDLLVFERRATGWSGLSLVNLRRCADATCCARGSSEVLARSGWLRGGCPWPIPARGFVVGPLRRFLDVVEEGLQTRWPKCETGSWATSAPGQPSRHQAGAPEAEVVVRLSGAHLLLSIGDLTFTSRCPSRRPYPHEAVVIGFEAPTKTPPRRPSQPRGRFWCRGSL